MRMMTGWMLLLGATLMLSAGCDEREAEAEAVSAEMIAAQAKAALVQDGEAPSCCPVPDRAEAIATTAPTATEPPAEADPADAGGGGAASATDAASRSSAWTDPADRTPFHLDYTLTDQDGHAVKLADLRGKPMAVTFFFTRCPLPTMCPLIVTTAAKLQEELAEAGLGEDVRLVLISYDPKHDTPAAMKTYGEDRGLAFTNAAMLVPRGEDLRNLIHEFQIGVQYYTDGSIGHFIEMIVIDREGRFVRDYTGGIWDNAAVAADLKKLASE